MTIVATLTTPAFEEVATRINLLLHVSSSNMDERYHRNGSCIFDKNKRSIMVLVIILPNTDGEADVRIDDYMVG